MKKAKLRNSVKTIKKASQINAKREKKQKAGNNHLSRRARKQQEREEAKNGYTSGQRILLLGEGNFSFAKALCDKLGGQPGIFATSYDSKDVCNRKYPDAKANKLAIKKNLGEVLHKVDAMRLEDVHNGLFAESFDRIIFNFPHLGHGVQDQEKNIRDHTEFLERFFRSAASCLKPPPAKAEIHVTLKEGEPYRSWKIVPACSRAADHLEVKTAIPFVPDRWPGYEHRRTIGFEPQLSSQDNLDIQKGAKTYIFGYKKNLEEVE